MEKKKYAIHPGFVRSQNDGDEHFISAGRLARLYELEPGEWFRWDDDYERRPWDQFVHLFPDYYGRYGRPNASSKTD